MKLLTQEVIHQMERNPLYSHDGSSEPLNNKVIVKFFNPVGAGTWLITEASKQTDGDWLMFGYCHINEWEWGYVSFNELKAIKLKWGMTIERDMYSELKTVREIIS